MEAGVVSHSSNLVHNGPQLPEPWPLTPFHCSLGYGEQSLMSQQYLPGLSVSA